MDLSDLRAELDRIDDALHDLIMRRAAIVCQVAARKAQAGTRGNLRPGREAAILRRLLARHAGDLPPAAVVRVWRELLAGALALQGPFIAAVTPGLEPVAREQFGALTHVQICTNPAGSLAAVRRGDASLAVLPLPQADEPEPWWQMLGAGPRLYVVARLPFWAPRPSGSCLTQAFAVAAMPADPSGDDRGLILAPEAVCAQLPGAGFQVGSVVVAGGLALADVEGCVADDDARLAGLSVGSAASAVLGAYACPVG